MPLEPTFIIRRIPLDDITIARRYAAKADQARDNGHEFLLSFNEYKRLVKRKKCYYTSIPFLQGDKQLGLSLDRIDNSKGYVSGNVVACLKTINTIKSSLENPSNPIGVKHLKRMCDALIKLGV
jgi:hypothetical protein